MMKKVDQKVNLNNDFVIDYGFPLGSGAYGDVYRGIWKSQKCFVAMKKIKEIHSDADSMLQQQVKIMEKIKHQNVLNLIKIIRTNDRGCFLIIQYCEGGSLEKQMAKQKIPELNCFEYLKQIVQGMAEVNSRKHIHRDLKPENILFTKQGILKICDFGLARKIIGNDPNKMQRFSAKGTPAYAAPQLLINQQYSGKCDVWSTGVILVQMLSGICPTTANPKVHDLSSLSKYHSEITKNGYFELQGPFNPWFKQIIKLMMAYNQNNRSSFYELKQKIMKDQQKLINQLTLGKQSIPRGLHMSILPINNNVPQNQYNAQVIENHLIKKQKDQEILNNLQNYLRFIYYRSKLFVDIGTKFCQSKQNKLHGGIKYLVLYLSIAIYVRSIQYLIDLIKSIKKIKLPDGTEVNVAIFQMLVPTYVQSLISEREKFVTTLKQIEDKLKSEKYSTSIPDFLKTHQPLLNELGKIAKLQSKKDYQYFQKQYNIFIKKQCLDVDVKSIPETFLRNYWVCLNLTNASKTLPIKDFKNNYIINGLIDKSIQSTYEELQESTLKLQKALRENV